MTTFTHPTPHKFALAASAIAGADYFIPTTVEKDGDDAVLTFTHSNKSYRFTEGPLQDSYDF